MEEEEEQKRVTEKAFATIFESLKQGSHGPMSSRFSN